MHQALLTEEEHNVRLKLHDANCVAELQTYQEQFQVVQHALNAQNADELRDSLLLSHERLRKEEMQCVQLTQRCLESERAKDEHKADADLIAYLRRRCSEHDDLAADMARQLGVREATIERLEVAEMRPRAESPSLVTLMALEHKMMEECSSIVEEQVERSDRVCNKMENMQASLRARNQLLQDEVGSLQTEINDLSFVQKRDPSPEETTAAPAAVASVPGH